MPLSYEEKKIIEARALTAARNAGVPIPNGEVRGEKPDFRFDEGRLGIEVTELLRTPRSNAGIAPAEEASYRQEVTRIAQERYYGLSSAKPANVYLFFANARGKKRDKYELARTLAEFVKANVPKVGSIASFTALMLPQGFGSMSIAAEAGDWICGQGANVTLSDIPEALTARIEDKNKRLPTYRRNLAPGAKVWLLLYSTISAERSLPIPHGIEDWRFSFDFDRVFWFACLEHQFVEIRRT